MIKEGVDLVSAFEGFSSKPYLCPAGVWTIGFGTTRFPNGFKVTKYEPECTREEAEAWLHHELERAEYYVLKYTNVFLNEYQLAALASFVYNLGCGAFRASTLRRRINAVDWYDVPYQMSRWNKAGGRVLNGLVRRREAEVDLWLHGEQCYAESIFNNGGCHG